MLLYGVDGIGKSSLSAEFPDPIYLATEGERPPSDIEMATPGTIESFDDLLNIIGELLTVEHDRRTVIKLSALRGLIAGGPVTEKFEEPKRKEREEV